MASSVSALKEAFALAEDLAAREHVIEKYIVSRTHDWYYYHGLVLLDKLRHKLEKSTNEDEIRDPTSDEAKLVDDVMQLLNEFAVKLNNRTTQDTRYTELCTRYHLMVYPILPNVTVGFIKDRLRLNMDLDARPRGVEGDAMSDYPEVTFPSNLDPALLAPHHVINQYLEEHKTEMTSMTGIEPAAVPWISSLANQSLTGTQERLLLHKILQYPQSDRTFPITEKIVSIWEAIQDLSSYYHEELSKAVEDMPLENLTLRHMEMLLDKLPVLKEFRVFVVAYMRKLVPPSIYALNQFSKDLCFDWDNESDVIADYLDALKSFVCTLPSIYPRLKADVDFCRLRVALLRKEYKKELLESYLAHERKEQKLRLDGAQFVSDPYMEIPVLSMILAPATETEVLEDYVAKLMSTGWSPYANLGDHLGNHKDLRPLVARVSMTCGGSNVEGVESWMEVLGASAFENLVAQTQLKFDSVILHVKKRRLPDDPIELTLQVKNIPHLIIRVFQIDMLNYWHLHPNTDRFDSNSMDLGGLSPIWEHSIDYSDIPSLHTHTQTFFFGEQGLASDIFSGRGAWVIDFVGGRNTCRSVVQKGHLRHVMQDTTAGHLVQVLDEENKPMTTKCKIWLANNYYEPDDDGSLLIPYSMTGAKESRMLLISNNENFCEAVNFMHKQEKYDLTAKFYINPESIVPKKPTKVVIIPMLGIHGRPAPLKLLQDTRLVVEATDAQNVKSCYVSEDLVVTRDRAIEVDFTIPNTFTVNELRFVLRAKAATSSEETPLQDLEVSHHINFKSCDKSIFSTHLRMTKLGNYQLHIVGKNGEPPRKYVVRLKLKHTAVVKPIEITMQTNGLGVISLGKLDHIVWICVTSPTEKTWQLLPDHNEATLPKLLHQTANERFKISYDPTGLERHCSLFQIGFHGTIVKDFSDYISQKNDYIEVEGLPKGRYRFYVTTRSARIQQIDCTVAQSLGIAAEKENSHWSGWLFSNGTFLEGSGMITSKNLGIASVDVSKDKVIIQLRHWSESSTFVLVTTSANVSSSDSLCALLTARHINIPLSWYAPLHMPATFQSGGTLCEEQRYIIHREKAEKWIGSTLNKPSLLIHPHKLGAIQIAARHLQGAQNYENTTIHPQTQSSSTTLLFNQCTPVTTFAKGESDLEFLNHHCPVLSLKPNKNGEVVIDRTLLGDGNVLQMAAISGEQCVTKVQLMNDVLTDLKTTDLRQAADALDPSKIYFQSKAACILNPQGRGDGYIELVTHRSEYQTATSMEEVFEILQVMPHHFGSQMREFEFLMQWRSFTPERKLELHEKYCCHELNLWLKHKDSAFFNSHIRPSIKGKLRKSFMDIYLLDQSLDKYKENMHLYQRLTNAEKALLARKIPELLPVVRQTFLDVYTPPPRQVRDQSFDAILDRHAITSAMRSQGDIDYGFSTATETPVSDSESIFKPSDPFNNNDCVTEGKVSGGTLFFGDVSEAKTEFEELSSSTLVTVSKPTISEPSKYVRFTHPETDPTSGAKDSCTSGQTQNDTKISSSESFAKPSTFFSRNLFSTTATNVTSFADSETSKERPAFSFGQSSFTVENKPTGFGGFGTAKESSVFGSGQPFATAEKQPTGFGLFGTVKENPAFGSGQPPTVVEKQSTGFGIFGPAKENSVFGSGQTPAAVEKQSTGFGLFGTAKENSVFGSGQPFTATGFGSAKGSSGFSFGQPSIVAEKQYTGVNSFSAAKGSPAFGLGQSPADAERQPVGFGGFSKPPATFGTQEPALPLAQAQAQTQSQPQYSPVTEHALTYDTDATQPENYVAVNDQYSKWHEKDEAMRQKKYQSQIKPTYSFVEPTSEWIDKEYYTTNFLGSDGVSPFWLDYVNCDLDQLFVSANFIYATHSFTEIMFALALLDLPFHAQAVRNEETRSGRMRIGSETPAVVFYRALQEADNTSVSDADILLRQGFFTEEGSFPDAYNMVPTSNLYTGTKYDVSSKNFICEVTLQIPIGSVPLGALPYCQSKSIEIAPYSTWREVVGFFYFPSGGSFYHMPVAVTKESELLGYTNATKLSVSEKYICINGPKLPWSVLVQKGSDEQVLHCLSEDRLNNADFSTLLWRMTNRKFARSVFDTLQQRRIYVPSIWQYGVYHCFADVIRELLQQEYRSLLSKVGYTFQSPLVRVEPEDHDTIDILDYFPVINARAHRIGENHEIINSEFFSQYTKLLDYLCQKSERSPMDYIVLCTYMILQERIGDAHAIYKRLLNTPLVDNFPMQTDYLGAYLQTRVRVDHVKSREELVDLGSIRATAQKYQEQSSTPPHWRKLFASLEDLVNGVEQRSGSLKKFTTEQYQVHMLRSEPLLDFNIKDGKLNIHHANLTNVHIRYYKMNVEMMFSAKPFMSGARSDIDTNWVKPHYEEQHALSSNLTGVEGENEDETFEIIGIGKVALSTTSISIPKSLLASDIMIDISSGNGHRHCQAHFAHALSIHIAESYGVLRVMSAERHMPCVGAYIKVYAKQKNGRVSFWKDGYTGLNGAFDYVSVTENNSLIGRNSVSDGTIQTISKFAILIMTDEDGTVIKEALSPFC
ncbi:hypothetical protein DFQ28_006599 [Apophysomyces sp. BC1034]|nr:hypothetical protein DFQ30_003387 [Apophysomyces sp. BC1015]KAG0183015.1 hypothetical protein DFQ29_000826 [Apophysomyces sp. BC1021]KAG0194750.1 hypothetical protein DFQ28_006599 [Apophysomyces sp. BC1034]